MGAVTGMLRRQSVFIALGGVLAGAALGFVAAPPRVETLPMPQVCERAIDVALEYASAVAETERATKDRREAGADYDRAVYEGLAVDVEDALEMVDETERILAGAETSAIAAKRALFDRANECLTTTDKKES